MKKIIKKQKIVRKKKAVKTVVETPVEIPVKSEKDTLLELYQTLKNLGINSIGDLEVKISRL